MKEKTLPKKPSASEAHDEHLLARRQREELKEELANHYASLPRRSSAKSRRVTSFTFFIDSSGIIRYVVLQPLTPATMKQGLASVGVSLITL